LSFGFGWEAVSSLRRHQWRGCADIVEKVGQHFM